jgi:hypothetical protein
MSAGWLAVAFASVAVVAAVTAAIDRIVERRRRTGDQGAQ